MVSKFPRTPQLRWASRTEKMYSLRTILGVCVGLLTSVGAIGFGAGVVEEVVQVTGRGSTRKAAVQEALVEAVGQVNGLEVEAKKFRQQLETVMADGENLHALESESFQSK